MVVNTSRICYRNLPMIVIRVLEMNRQNPQVLGAESTCETADNVSLLNQGRNDQLDAPPSEISSIVHTSTMTPLFHGMHDES